MRFRIDVWEVCWAVLVVSDLCGIGLLSGCCLGLWVWFVGLGLVVYAAVTDVAGAGAYERAAV